MNTFINRHDELALLEAQCSAPGSSLVVVYGRRRVGKTALLRQLCMSRPGHLFFVADQTAPSEQLLRFSTAVAAATGDASLISRPFPTWDSAVAHLFGLPADRCPVVVFDEFPYACASEPALPSIIQRHWDERSSGSTVNLVLCGSHMSFMEGEVLGHRSPLFGRRTAQLVVEDLAVEHVASFLPSWSDDDLIRTHAILGGTPAYLERFDPARGLRDAVLDAVLTPTAPLYSEPRFLLQQELREPALYFSLLRSVASGRTRLNDIVQGCGDVERHKAGKYLSTLLELRLLRREWPIDERHPEKSRRGIYQIAAPFLRFWFRYVYPHTAQLEHGDAGRVWSDRVEPSLDDYTACHFEALCRDWLWRPRARERLGFHPTRIGRWWRHDAELDVVAHDDEGHLLVGEAKWSRHPVGVNVLADLEVAAARYGTAAPTTLALFSRSGFTAALRARAATDPRILLVGPADVLGRT